MALPAKSRKLNARLAPKKKNQRAAVGKSFGETAFTSLLSGGGEGEDFSAALPVLLSSSASQANRTAATTPSAPSSKTGVRQLEAVTTRHPAYIGPAKKPMLAP